MNRKLDGNEGECTVTGEDLVLYMYGEETQAQQEHIRGCSRCAREIQAFRRTFDTIDSAGLEAMATYDAPVEWSEIRTRLEQTHASPARYQAPQWSLARAAAVLFMIGTAFVVGREWDALLEIAGLHHAPAAETLTQNSQVAPPASGLERFSNETNGYLDRSRRVLLEYANSDVISGSSALNNASSTLLRENSKAREVAGRIQDARIETLLKDLESILKEIVTISRQGDGTVQVIKEEIHDVINRLDLLESELDHVQVSRPTI